jgi:hypothetical protein
VIGLKVFRTGISRRQASTEAKKSKTRNGCTKAQWVGSDADWSLEGGWTGDLRYGRNGEKRGGTWPSCTKASLVHPCGEFIGTIAYPGLPGLRNLSIGVRSCMWVLKPVPQSQLNAFPTFHSVAHHSHHPVARLACLNHSPNPGGWKETRRAKSQVPNSTQQHSLSIRVRPIRISVSRGPRDTLDTYATFPMQSADFARHLPTSSTG